MVILIHVPNCDFVFFLSPHLFHVVQDISRLSCGKQLVCVGNAWSDERRAYSRCLRVKSFLRSSFCGIARCVVCQTPSSHSRSQHLPVFYWSLVAVRTGPSLANQSTTAMAIPGESFGRTFIDSIKCAKMRSAIAKQQ